MARFRFLILLLGVGLAACLLLDAGSAAAQPKAIKRSLVTPETLLRLKHVTSVQVSPDGKRVVYTVRQAITDGDSSEHRSHLTLASADGTDPVALTQGPKSCDHPQWSPDGTAIAYLSSRSGKRNVWVLKPREGDGYQLTSVSTAVSTFKWAPDGKSIAFTAVDPPSPEEEKANKSKSDVHVVDEQVRMSRLNVVTVAGPKSVARVLTKGNYSAIGASDSVRRGGMDWSPDGKTIVFTQTKTPRAEDWPTARLALVAVESGVVRPLSTAPGVEFAPCYAPDGHTIAFLKAESPPTWAGNARIHTMPATGGSPRPLAETHDRFGRGSDLLGWSADGKRLYFSETRGTVLTLNALPLEGPPEIIGPKQGWSASGFQLNARRTMVGFSWEGTARPPEAYVSRLDKFEPVPVSSLNAEFRTLLPVHTEVIRWQSADKQEIEGLLTYPADYEKGKRFPLLLVIHGGPMGVYAQNFVAAPSSHPVALFAANGYAVLRPNPRGSSGYGAKFRHANYGDWGGGDYHDLMAGVDRVIELGIADAERMGVMGWSYGGYLTAWTVTQTKRFKAASVGAGVTNLASLTATTDLPGLMPDYFRGEPWTVPEVYRLHSPITHVKGVTTPTLIQHGERDERVPASQGYEFYNALKRQGCTVKMVVYPRTGHVIDEPKLLAESMHRNLEWFDRHVLGK